MVWNRRLPDSIGSNAGLCRLYTNVYLVAVACDHPTRPIRGLPHVIAGAVSRRFLVPAPLSFQIPVGQSGRSPIQRRPPPTLLSKKPAKSALACRPWFATLNSTMQTMHIFYVCFATLNSIPQTTHTCHACFTALSSVMQSIQCRRFGCSYARPCRTLDCLAVQPTPG